MQTTHGPAKLLDCILDNQRGSRWGHGGGRNFPLLATGALAGATRVGWSDHHHLAIVALNHISVVTATGLNAGATHQANQYRNRKSGQASRVLEETAEHAERSPDRLPVLSA